MWDWMQMKNRNARYLTYLLDVSPIGEDWFLVISCARTAVRAAARMQMQALTNATKCNIHDCERRSDNLLRNGVIPLNRDATTGKSYVAGPVRAIELWTVIMRDLWIRRKRYLSLWVPATLLNILPGAGVCVPIAQHNSLADSAGWF